MQRNLYARVEVLFPVKDQHLRERICNEVLAGYLSDTRKARLLEQSGTYSRPRSIRNGHGFSVQEYLLHQAQIEAPSLNGNHRPGNAKMGQILKIFSGKPQNEAVAEPKQSTDAADQPSAMPN